MNKCPTCARLKLKSKLYVARMGTSTLMGGEVPYYDEDGKYHDHDSNRLSVNWHCSKGHTGYIYYGNKCSNCNFGSKTQIHESIDKRTIKAHEKAQEVGHCLCNIKEKCPCEKFRTTEICKCSALFE